MRKKYLIKQFLLIVVYPKQKEEVAISSQESIQLFSKWNRDKWFFSQTQENVIFHLRVPRIFLFQAAFKLEVFSFISLNSLRKITSIWRERNKIITLKKQTNQPVLMGEDLFLPWACLLFYWVLQFNHYFHRSHHHKSRYIH